MPAGSRTTEARAGGASSRRRCSAPPTRTSCGAATARPSSPAIPGSPTGGATPSSRCAACASPGGRSTTRATILLAWAAAVSEGMLPNRFPDARRAARVQLGRRLALVRRRGARAARGGDGRPHRRCRRCSGPARRRRRDPRRATTPAPATASAWTTTACSRPASPGVQLTWMDAKVGDWVVTPRIGKPVEVQALWLNALAHRRRDARPMAAALRRGTRSRRSQRASGTSGGAASTTWSTSITCRAQRRCDVAPEPDLRRRRAAATRFWIERSAAAWSTRSSARLLTPLGLRIARARRAGLRGRLRRRRARARRRPTTRARSGPGCSGRSSRPGCACAAGRRRRSARRDARFLDRRCASTSTIAGLGHLSEIADGEPPHTPRGCPFQAWSLGELLRAS